MAGENKGKVTQVVGAVLDIRFDEGKLPSINEAIRIPTMDGGELTVDAEEKDGSIENLYLTGPAAMVCAGEILDEAILKLVKRQEEKT